MTIGRPSIYSPELADTICSRMSEGRSLRSVCRDEDMPGLTTVVRWFKEPDKEDFRAQYAIARESLADALAEETLEIADDSTGDVNRDRLRVDTRKWFASKVGAKKYGDKLALGGDPDAAPMKVELTLSEAGRSIAFALAAAKQDK
jgi:hypothetical protein